MSGDLLKPEESVLVVVDVQARLLPHIHEHPRVVESIRLMLRTARTLDMPVLMTTQYAKGLGPTHDAVAELAPPAAPFDKQTFSCFGSSEFTQALTATGRRSLLLCGVETHVCVLQTGLDALATGYRVHLVTDASGARTAANEVLGQRRLEKAGTVLSSSEMVLYELLRTSASPAFKSLLPHLK